MNIEQRLKRVDRYNTVIGTEKLTSRRASENFHDCPPLEVVANGVRDIRVALDGVYRDLITDDEEHLAQQDLAYDQVRDQYWDMARRTPSEFAGTPDSIEGYFEVLHFRQEQQVRDNLRDRYLPGSLPIIMLDMVELYARELGTSIAASTRIANIFLQSQFEAIRERAGLLRATGQFSETEATTEAFKEFTGVAVPNHIAQIRDEIGESFPLETQIKDVSYPARPQVDTTSSGLLYVKADEVEGFVRVYDLERRPITQEEMNMATTLMDNEQLRTSLLLYHMAIVDYSAQYFAAHPDHMQYGMMSFNRFFVLEGEGEDVQFLPNPSLIATLSNNLAPAIAAVMIREGASVDDLSSDYIAKGIVEVKSQHLFQSHIGKFNNHGQRPDIVELDGFFNQVCPATKVVMTGLTDWLPSLYDSCARI